MLKIKMSAEPKFSFLLQHFYSCAPPEGFAFPCSSWSQHTSTLWQLGGFYCSGGHQMTKSAPLDVSSSHSWWASRKVFKKGMFLIHPWSCCEILICRDQEFRLFAIYVKFCRGQIHLLNDHFLCRTTCGNVDLKWQKARGASTGSSRCAHLVAHLFLQRHTFWLHNTCPKLEKDKVESQCWDEAKEQNFRIWDHVWQQFWGISFSGIELYSQWYLF